MNEYVTQYEQLIHKMTNYFPYYESKEDLYQAGFMGLIKASKTYNPDYGVKFSTFAFPSILGEMKKVIREDKRIHLSRNVLSLKLKIEKISLLLSQQLMRNPTSLEIADALGLDVTEVEGILQIQTQVSSLDDPIIGEENDMSYYDILEKPSLDLNTLIALKEELVKLKEPAKTLMFKRYFENYTQTEVADYLGMNQVQVSRLENKVKEKIKQNLS